MRAGAEQRGEALADTSSGRRDKQSSREVEQSRGAEVISRGETVANPDRDLGQQGWEDNAEERPRGRNIDRSCLGQDLAYSRGEHGERIVAGGTDTQERSRQIERSTGSRGDGIGRWPVEPGMGRVAHGVANRVDRIKALGNGQVPRVAATAFTILSIDD